MSIFFKPPIDIEILFDNEESRKHVDSATRSSNSSYKSMKESLPVYEDGESLGGIVTLRVRDSKKVDHLGIKVSVIGSIDMLKSHGSGNSSSKKVTSSTSSSSSNGSVDVRKNSVDQFLCQSYDLCPAGELQHSQSFPFLFRDLSKRYESYKGKNVDVAYYVKVTVMRKSTDISKIKRFWVYLYNSVTTAPNTLSANETKATTNDIAGGNYAADNASDNTQTKSTQGEAGDVNQVLPISHSNNEPKPVRLDIGIENCLHIEFEYAKSQYSLKEVIVGRIYFLLTRLRIKHMELSLITRESSGLQTSNVMTDSTAIRYEIMDGSSVKGETIPIRLFLSGYDLTPNMSCNYFNVKNYLSLVIIDEDGRRYFKQSEITLYRTR
ncbi:AVN_HP_G0106500.mRNA.1.CDS.1 [Saccharomyces cerevisiae]|nr:BEM_HP_G0130260.mRNA.1.CDS.1 [Saccharomyces cerevisiae]CAI4932973.1 ANM_HP_G0114030.mRNA.1.CDS.1 [Saccharomyces cerevisiae]CAI4944456.1 BEM_HP_G0140390.mRNA.1.CDS.1 [Saccharomyces cerevisiae]CAI4954119.1 BEM_HP_G0006050.mRNA.1.CDS.1 [Saccharomyces cerevisiae]CAI4986750.1 BEM_HP_G0170160.mRNA.1.CDS.1 [Saccharomyces cerevisiae]